MFKFSEVENIEQTQKSSIDSSGFSFSEMEKQPDLTKVGVQDVFSLDGRNTNAVRKLSLINKSWFDKFVESAPAKFGDSMTKATVRGMFDIGDGIGTLIEFYGDNMILEKGAFGLDDKTIHRLNTFGRGWQKAGQSIRKGTDFVLNSKGLQFDKDIFEGTIVDNPSVTRVSAAIMSAIPSVLAMKSTAAATGSTGLAYFTMGAVDSADVYTSAKEVGKTQDEANLLYTTSMAGTALIDRLLSPLEKVLGGKPTTIWKQLSKRITAGLSEGTAEASQTVWQNAVKKYGIDDTQSLADGVIEAAIGGFGSASAMAGTFNDASDRLKAQGATEQEINAIADVMGEYIQKHPDELNDIAFQQLEKGLNEFDKFVEEHKGMPEAQKTLQIKAELEQIHNEVAATLKKNGVSANIAEADAKIWQGIALFGSQETGLSPMEYINQRAPKVKKERVANFLQRFGETKKKVADGNLELFEALVNDKIYKQLAKADQESRGDSLLRFLKKAGGLKDVGGDLKAMDAGKSYIGLINNKAGRSMDDMTLSAWEAGYFPQHAERPEIDDLLEAIRDELFGNKHYAHQENKAPSMFDEVNDLAEQMDMLGIDYSQMTALEAEKAFDEAVARYSKEQGIENVVLDEIPFQGGEASNIVDLTNAFEGKPTEKEVEEYLNSLIGKAMDTASKPLQIQVTKGNKAHIKRSNVELKHGQKNRHFAALTELEKIVNKAVKNDREGDVDLSHNTHKDTIEHKKNIEKYVYFDSDVKIGDDYFTVKLTSEQVKGQDENLLDLYNVQVKRKSPVRAYDTLTGDPSSFNIAQNSENVNRALFQGGENANIYGATNSNEEPIANPANFNAFIEGSRVTENDEPVSPENPPKKIYRGDTRYFEEYEAQENAYEYDWGKGFYLSDNYDDIATNYQRGGADLTNRIEREAEQLSNEEDIDYDEAKEKIKEKYEQDDIIREFYLSIKNPVIVGGNKETFFEYELQQDEDGEVDYDSDPTGKGFELIGSIENYLYDIGADDYVQAIAGELQMQMADNGGLSASEVEDVVRGIEEANYLLDYESTAGEMLSSAFGSIGFDGIIDHRAGTKFKNMDMDSDTTHYIVFNSEQAKSADNKGEWSSSPNFYMQDQAKPKGAYMQNLDRNGVIYLFEKANASTFMHETAHFFFKELQEFGTERSKAMLQKVNGWADLEFDQRFKTKAEGGGIVVVDKLGNIVYGDAKPFLNVKSAREYAKNELFARGFEQYLREGKAPNSYLKQAFRSFWNWLRHLYRSADELNVNINDDIRGIYSEIIGGKELDFYLTAPVDEVLRQHFDETKDRKAVYDEQIRLAQTQPVSRGFWTNIAQEKTDGAKGRNKWWNKAIVPISTRAKRVSVRLKNRLRAYDYGVGARLNQYYKQMKPFLDIWATFTETDAVAFDLALKNSYVEKQLEIVKKYNAYNEFVEIKNLLNNLFDQAVDVGIEIGYTADYFPRQVEDVEGFMRALYGSPFESQLRRALREADPDNVMTNEQKAEFLNKYLRGFNRRDLNKPLIGNTKDRQIDIVTAEMNKYYKPSMQALINYVEGMNASIESRKFWGFKYDDIEQSVGSLTADLVDSGFISPEQDAEVQEILKARFKAKGVSNKWLNLQKNAAYVYTMGGLNSAITQLDDLSVSLYKAGFWNTVNSILSPNKAGLSREELGLEKIGQEFAEASASSKAVSAVFKMTGLDKIDAFGKNTLINATFRKFQQMANNNEAELRSYLEPIMEQETDQTIEDIKSDNISENVKLLMFNELADVQPIALSEMPEWYLTSGNGRVFYMLKTFTLKRIDIFRNECFDKMRNGDAKTGVQNLFKLSMLMMICGAGKDELINLLFGRKFNLSDTLVNNLLGLFGISKYALYKTRDEGFAGFLASVGIPPVFAPASDLMSDVYKSLFSAKGKDISDFEVWKGVPVVGRLYYWWFGGGHTKEKRKNKKTKLK